MTDYEFDSSLFNYLSNLIKYYIYRINDLNLIPLPKSYINICCDEEQITFLLPILKIIQEHNPKPLSYSQNYYDTIMYTLLIYLFYSLVLGEQIDDFIDSSIILKCMHKYCGSYSKSRDMMKIVEKLYFDICTQDNLPYYSRIRRMFFGMD
jgi:hypothetical protein